MIKPCFTVQLLLSSGQSGERIDANANQSQGTTKKLTDFNLLVFTRIPIFSSPIQHILSTGRRVHPPRKIDKAELVRPVAGLGILK
jgi:hypothetical protein